MDNQKDLNSLRHSSAHLLAAAVLKLYPNTKLTIGPAIESGFYYDMDFDLSADGPIAAEDLEKIEKTMRQILPTWTSFGKREVSEKEAKELYKDNPYKLELIDEIVKKGEPITLYKAGDFEDLCRGGHSENPSKEIGAVKLLSIAGAYWRGSEKNQPKGLAPHKGGAKMLTRIYGTAFPTQKELEAYLQMLEEARKRDHRKLGKELDLFTFSDLVGKGLPLFTPKGTILRELLNDFSQKLRIKRGFQKVWIPHIAKNDLYKTSGHWDKFGDELFLVKSQETEDQMVLKPMNCPHHQQIYASKTRSYKDLPIKYLETTTIYRDEKAGELIGLSRVRSATQDDSHTFCRADQIKEVYQSLIEIVQEFYGRLDMKFRARLSFMDPNQPEKYLGEAKLWEKAQQIILEVAKENKLDYFIAEGEAAFYGPKIDFMVLDALGREWQLATPQLDFVQPKRFGLSYVDENGKEQTPVMIHFALMGSIERFLSVYIEHTGGAFPVWLAPVQVKIVPITDRNADYAQNILEQLNNTDMRTEVDSRAETMQSKIRNATFEKIPYILIIGDREQNDNKVAVRSLKGENLGVMNLDNFVKKINEELDYPIH